MLPQSLLVGRPVISYDVDGAKEVVRPETGVLLPPATFLVSPPQSFDSPPIRVLRSAMGREGRQRFTHQFRHETMTDQLRDLYGLLLQRADTAVASH